MAHCSVCGTECDCFEVISGGCHYFFDRVDCAVEALSAQCATCDERIYGDAVELEDRLYCSAQCACVQDDFELDAPVGVVRKSLGWAPALLMQRN